MQEAAKLGAGEAFLLTTTASHFFRHLGFKVMDRDDAPAAILNTRQATAISSATLLARRIRD
jgi:arsenate reductase